MLAKDVFQEGATERGMDHYRRPAESCGNRSKREIECRKFAGSLGSSIRMYFDEHVPPHFHAIYGEYEVQVGIDPIEVLAGKLPRRATSMVIEWAALYQWKLMSNWERLQHSQPIVKIAPLE